MTYMYKRGVLIKRGTGSGGRGRAGRRWWGRVNACQHALRLPHPGPPSPPFPSTVLVLSSPPLIFSPFHIIISTHYHPFSTTPYPPSWSYRPSPRPFYAPRSSSPYRIHVRLLFHILTSPVEPHPPGYYIIIYIILLYLALHCSSAAPAYARARASRPAASPASTHAHPADLHPLTHSLLRREPSPCINIRLYLVSSIS